MHLDERFLRRDAGLAGVLPKPVGYGCPRNQAASRRQCHYAEQRGEDSMLPEPQDTEMLMKEWRHHKPRRRPPRSSTAVSIDPPGSVCLSALSSLVWESDSQSYPRNTGRSPEPRLRESAGSRRWRRSSCLTVTRSRLLDRAYQPVPEPVVLGGHREVERCGLFIFLSGQDCIPRRSASR